MVQGGDDGRDHHPNAFTMWLAGGGFKPGATVGATDDLGFNAVEDVVHVHDLHATILHQLGFDHTQLNIPLSGARFPPDRRARSSGRQVARVRAHLLARQPVTPTTLCTTDQSQAHSPGNICDMTASAIVPPNNIPL